MNTLHIQSLLTLRLPLLDPHLLKVHVRAVKDGARVPRIRPLFGAEVRELFALEFLRRGVVLCGDAAEESGLSDAGLFEVRVYFSPDFVAGVYAVLAAMFYTRVYVGLV